jgi:hypothetical protein
MNSTGKTGDKKRPTTPFTSKEMPSEAAVQRFGRPSGLYDESFNASVIGSWKEALIGTVIGHESLLDRTELSKCPKLICWHQAHL